MKITSLFSKNKTHFSLTNTHIFLLFLCKIPLFYTVSLSLITVYNACMISVITSAAFAWPNMIDVGYFCQGVDLSAKLLVLANRFKNTIKLALFTISMYFSCISDRNWFILHKFHSNYPSQYIDHLPHLRIHSLYRYVLKDQQFITCALNHNSPIEGITSIEHALV